MKVNCFKRVLSCVLIMTCLLTSIPAWAVEDEEAMPYEKIYVENDPTNQALLDSVELPDFIELPYRYSQVTLVLETNKDVTYRYKMKGEASYHETSDNLVIVDMKFPGRYELVIESKEGEQKKNYLVLITREAPSSDATLNGVSISVDGAHQETEPMYSKDVEGVYRMEVRNSVSSVEIAARPSINSSFSSCYLVVNDDIGNMTEFESNKRLPLDLNVGKNRFKIRSQAEDGTVKDYTYEITRAGINHEPILNVSYPTSGRSIEKGHNYGFSLEGSLEDEDGDNTTVRASIGGVLGNVWRNPNDRSQFSLDWGVDDLAPGTYQGIDIEYSDGQVNKTWKWPYTLVITPAPGNSLPVLDIQLPSSDVTLTDKFILSGQIKDDNTEDVTVMAIINNVPKSVRLLATPEGKPFELEWSIDEIHNGTYANIRVGAYDKLDSDQVTNATWNHSLTVNDSQNLNRMPIVSFDPSCLYHTSGSYGTFEVSGTVQDPDLDSVTVSATIGGKTQSTVIDTKVSSSWTLAWQLNELIPETYTDIPINITDGTNTSQLTWNKRLVVEPFVDQAPYFEAITPLDDVELNEGTFRITADIRDRECDELTLTALIDGVEAKVVKKANPHYNLFRLEWDITEISNGDYSDIELIAVDEKNNKTITTVWSHTLTVNKGNQSPRLVVDQPQASVDFKAGSFSITGSVEDHEGDDVEVSGTLGGVTKSITVENASSRAAYSLTWDRSDFTGTGTFNNVTVTADDNKSASVSVTKNFVFNLVTDNDRPSGTITSPLADTLLEAGNFVLRGTASDTDSVTVSATINNVKKTDTVNPGQSDWTLTWSKSELESGTYDGLEVTLDDGDLQKVLRWYQSLKVNNQPELVLTSPDSDQSLTAGVFTLSGTAFDSDRQGMTVSATIDGETRETRVYQSETPSEWSLTWNKSDLLQADKSVDVTITDHFGTPVTKTWAYELKKNVLPTINITTQGNQTLTEGTFDLLGNITNPEDEDLTVKLHILDETYTTRVTSGQTEFSFSIDYAELIGDSDYKVYDAIRVSAEDSIGSSEVVAWPYTLTVTQAIENRLPTITIDQPNVDVYLTAGTYTISGSVDDLDGDEVTVSSSIDGQEKTTTIIGSGDFTFEWDKSTIAQRDYSDITIKAFDSQGGQTTHELEHNLYKNEKPIVTITSDEEALLSGSLTLTGTVYDRENDYLEVTASIGSVQKSVRVSDTSSTPTWSMDFSYEELLGDSSISQTLDIKASARDSLLQGDEIIRTAPLELIVNTPPSIELDLNSEEVIRPEVNLTLAGSVSDPEGGIIEVYASIGSVRKSVQVDLSKSSSWELSWAYSDLPHGITPSLVVYAKDSYGFISQTGNTPNILVNKEPTIEITGLEVNKKLIDGQFIIEGTYTDEDDELVTITANIDGLYEKEALVTGSGSRRSWKIIWNRSEIIEEKLYRHVIIQYKDEHTPLREVSREVNLRVASNSAPSLVISSPNQDEALIAGSFTLSGNVSDIDGDGMTVTASIDGIERQVEVAPSDMHTDWSFTWNKKDLVQEDKNVQVTVTDTRGGTTIETWAYQLKKNVLPTVSITTLGNQTLTEGSFDLEGSVTNPEDEEVTLKLHILDKIYTTSVSSGQSNFSFSVDYADLRGDLEENKVYDAIKITAEDSMGSSQVSWPYTLTLTDPQENRLPNITINSPTGHDYLTAGSFVIAGSVRDLDGDEVTVSCSIDGIEKTVTITELGDFTFEWDKSALNQVDYTEIVVTALDSQGGQSTYDLDYDLYKNEKPVVTITSNETELVSGTLTLAGTVYDRENETIEVTASIGSVQKSVRVSDTSSTPTWSMDFTYEELLGDLTETRSLDVKAFARDSVITGDEVIRDSQLTLVYNTAPELTWIGPIVTELSTSGSSITFSGHVNDLQGGEITVYAVIGDTRKETRLTNSDENTIWRLTWSYDELPHSLKGSVRNIKVIAEDSYGAMGQIILPHTIMVNKAPSLTVTSPSIDRTMIYGKLIVEGTTRDYDDETVFVSATLDGKHGKNAIVSSDGVTRNWKLEWDRSELSDRGKYHNVVITYFDINSAEKRLSWPIKLQMKENTLPVVTFDQETDYYLTQDTEHFVLSGRVTDVDGGPLKVRLTLDDEEETCDVVDGLWSFDFTKSQLTHKTYDKIVVYADDSQEGTVSKKWPGKLIVDDNVSPVLRITSPTSHESLIPGEFVLSGSVTDGDNHLVTVSAIIDGHKQSMDVNTAETNEWSLTWDKSDLTQKDYTITVTAEDEYKASVSETWAYTLKENIGPSIEITSPLSDQELYTGDFVLRGIVTNPEEEDITVSATINGHKMTETVLKDSDGVFTLTWQKHMIGQETIDGIEITATDSSKTARKLWDYTLRDINHLPVLEVEVPNEDFTHLKGKLVIKGKVNDSDGSKVTVKAQIGTYRSAVIEDIQGETPFELVWDRSALADGTYKDIEIIAEDATGAQVKVDYVNVQVLDDPDNTLPELVITHPTTPRIVAGSDSFILRGTVEDVDEEDVYVRAFIKGVKKEVKVEANSEAKEWQLEWTKKELDKLDITGFTVYADDGSKDLTQVEHNKRLQVRNSAPVIRFTSPTSKYVLKGDKFVLEGTVHDDEENWMVLSAKLKGIDGSDVESIARVKYENGVGSWKFEWLKSDLMNRTYNGIEIIYDEAHHFEQTIRWPYELKITDETNEKPELTIDDIGSFELTEGSFELTGHVSDYENNPVSVSTSIVGRSFDGLIEGDRWTISLDKAALPYGQHTGIVVTASDAYGFSSKTWPNTLTVVNTHPAVLIETSEDTIVLDQGSFTLSGTVSDMENDTITLEAQLGKTLKTLEVDTENENVWSMTWTKDEIGPIEATSIEVHVKMNEILSTLTWAGTIEVVNKKPTFEINVPSENLIMAGDTYTLSGRVQDIDNQTVTVTALVGDQRFDTSLSQTKDGVDWTIECLRSDLNIGIHPISFEVTDGISSQVYDSGYTLDVKDKPPVFGLSSQGDQTLSEGSFSLEGTVEDPEGRSVIIKASIGGIEKTFNSKVNNLGQNWLLTWDYEDLASDDYSDIVVSADDGTNLVNQTWSYTLSVANKRPELSLYEAEGDFEMLDGKYVLKSGVFVIKGQVSDPENDELSVYATIGDHTEEINLTPSGQSDFELSFSKADLDNRTYSDIEVIADDKNGDVIKSTWTHTLEVKDLSSPQVRILSPRDDRVMTNGSFTISGQVTDPDGGKVKLEATIDGVKAEVEVEDTSSSQSFSLTWDVGELSRTTYQNVQVKAVDDTGRSSSELWSHKLRVRDYTPPVVSFDNDEDIRLIKGSFTISGRVSDMENDDVHLQVRVGDLYKNIQLTGTQNDKTWSATFDKKNFDNGDYTIEVHASDITGSKATATWAYKLIVADDVVKMHALDPGQEVTFVGRSWKVLDPTNGLAILTENVGSRPWSTRGESDYKDSDIRKYLNEVFISKEVLETLSLQTWSWSGDAVDKVGLLSRSEYETYKSLLDGPDFTGDWWLLDSEMDTVSNSLSESSIKSIYPVVHFETSKDVVNSVVDSGGFVIDTVSPIISIKGVSDNGTYRGSVSPVVSITDNVSKLSEMTVVIQLNGKDFASGTGISELGHHVLRVYVTDKNGNAKEESLEFDLLKKQSSSTSSSSSGSNRSSSKEKKKVKRTYDIQDVLVTDKVDLKGDTASVEMNTALFRQFTESKDDFIDNPYVVMVNKELKYSETKEILKKLDPLSEDRLTGIGHRAFTLDMSLSNEDGEYKGIDYFDEPLKVSIDLSKNFAVNQSNKDQLTAIRYEKDYSGHYRYEKLGGNYNAKDKTFTFYTNQDGLFNIMVSDTLTQINLQIDNPVIQVDETSVRSDVAPRIIGGRTIVPIRFIAEHLDAKVKWFEKERKVTITKNGRVMPLYIDKPLRGYNMSPIIVNSRTMVPLRYVYEAFGAKVMWFPSTRKIMVVK